MRSRNAAFQRAIAGLTHPLTIIAIVVLLVNDHWLRWQYPSWLTGKLGDFVWLIFAPFIAAIVFSWLIPRRLKAHEQIVGLVSFGLIGLWFALGKTEPAVHRLTVSLLETLMNWHDTLRMDASDLLMLPGLWVGWWIWQHSHETRFRPSAHVVFALGIMATLANSPGPSDAGIQCIGTLEDKLVTLNGGYNLPFTFYSSHDGGMSWEQADARNMSQVATDLFKDCRGHIQNQPFILVDPAKSNIQYRFQEAHSIERSEDGGQNWKIDIDLSSIATEARRSYHYQKTTEIGIQIVAYPGPFDAIFDNTTGNLVVAMGHEGVLVRTKSGEWNWVAVGLYRYANINQIDHLIELLKTELLLAAILILLFFPAYLQSDKPLFTAVIVWGSWVLWVFGVLLPPQKWSDGLVIINLGLFRSFTTLIAGVLALLLSTRTFTHIMDQKIGSKQVKETLLLGLGSGTLFLLPYLLWSQGTIPTYSSASIFGLMVGLASVVSSGAYLHRKYPPVVETPPTVEEVE